MSNLTRRTLIQKAAIVAASLGAIPVKNLLAVNPSPSGALPPIWYIKGLWVLVLTEQGGFDTPEEAVCACELHKNEFMEAFPVPENPFWNEDPIAGGTFTQVRSSIASGKPASDVIWNSYTIGSQLHNGKYHPKLTIRAIRFVQKPDGTAGYSLPSQGDTFDELFDAGS